MLLYVSSVAKFIVPDWGIKNSGIGFSYWPARIHRMEGWYDNPISHCKEPIPKIRNKHSQKRSCTATVLISTFMCRWAIYIFPRSICLFFCRKYVDRSWEYINNSQKHKCGNWDWDRAIPRKGKHKWDFRCSAESTIQYIPSPIQRPWILLLLPTPFCNCCVSIFSN